MAAALVASSALPASAQVGKNLGALEANKATKDEMVGKGIEGHVADAIIAGRPYADMLALDKALGGHVNAEQKKTLYTKVFLPINLNTATRPEIMLVPGMGPRMAHEFEEYRPYVAIAQFRREMGKYVDPNEVARLEQYVFVPLDLNTASDADLLTIPGLGNRMLHEFKEYRPYRSMEQFRREIGKYVDKNEVARLERYVYIKQ
jgi:DNA uptake protein ComE-like DNA-binding protein